MRRVSLAAVLGAAVLLSPAALRGEDATLTRPKIRKLDLGLYGRVHPPSQALQMLRFESSVDVTAAAPRTPNETMLVFWEGWQLSTGSIYGKGINIQNQGCPTCVNILPLIDKLIDKIKKK
jgi:hypothetical protein